MVQTMLKLVTSHEPIFRVASKTESMGHISVPPLYKGSFHVFGRVLSSKNNPVGAAPRNLMGFSQTSAKLFQICVQQTETDLIKLNVLE